MKTDEARGPFAAWLRRERLLHGWKELEARRRLELAAAPGVSFSTYRDIEAGNRKPTADQRTAIVTVFGEPPLAGASTAPQPEVPAALYDRIDNLVAELQADRLAWAEDRRLIRDLLDLLVRQPDDPVEQAVTASKVEVLAAEEAAARELERTRLTPPRSGPRNPDGARRRTSREGETA